MGLDMYIERYPRMNLNPHTIDAVESFAEWVKEGLDYSFESWCGYTENDLPDKSMIVKLLGMLHTTYYVWDNEKRYPHTFIHDEVGYWRKVNAVHKWFVDNVQDGEDDCVYHRPVTKDDLEALFELCREVLADHSRASELLPNTSGFFFGSQQYDDWYFVDIENTANLCKKLIEETDFEKYELYYRSSW